MSVLLAHYSPENSGAKEFQGYSLRSQFQAGHRVRGTVKTRPMRVEDVEQVLAIERCSFPLPWSGASFIREICEIENSHLLVVTEDEAPPDEAGALQACILGYACWWEVVDECHITNFAVAPAHRRKGLGGFLLERILEGARARGLVRATLEVRLGNAAAVALYERWGFKAIAMRPRYYPDNQEDALIMWKERI